MIEIHQLSKHFGRFTAVDNLSVSIKAGEVLGLLGPNGAGKSTTMRMISGFLKPDAGYVSIFGHEVAKQPLAAKQLLGYLPEGAPSYGDMRVVSFLEFIAQARAVPSKQRQRVVTEVMQRLHLSDVAQRPIETLSKGFQRRVGIAQAILHDPKVLILDEPTDGLDPNQKFEIRQLIRELSSDKIVVISTHILEEVEAICQRAVIINQGKLVADATPAQLRESSKYFQAVEFSVEHESLAIEAEQSLQEALFSVEGVAAVERDSVQRDLWVVIPDSGQVIFPAVQNLLNKKGVAPKSIAVSAGRLDDVFRRITQTEAL
ncbi:MAG: ABC transporter ATP-binding protein [Cellvibrionaceae bacterium]